MEQDNKVTCTFKDLTPAQANTLAQWYSGQGEQDADIWSQINCEDPAPVIGAISMDENGNVVAAIK